MKPFSQFLLLLTVLVSTSAFAQQAPTEFSAYYEASTNGIRGNAERHLVLTEDNNYRLNISLEARMGGINIGDLEQSSEFVFEDGIIRPTNYNYQVSGVSSDVESVAFNWDAGIALSAEEDQSWTIELAGNVLDQLSYQQALAMDVAEGKIDALEYLLVDGAEVETHRFRYLGAELIETPMGKFNSIKLERIRESDNGRSTTIWLASDWDYLLARIEQNNPSGLKIELQLTNALVAGEQVTPLP